MELSAIVVAMIGFDLLATDANTTSYINKHLNILLIEVAKFRLKLVQCTALTHDFV